MTMTTDVLAASETKRALTAEERALINGEVERTNVRHAMARGIVLSVAEFPDIPEFLRRA